MECPRCNGSGSCSDCGGSGRLECPTCGGKGERQTPRGLTYSCKTCSGEGQIDCRTDCSSCEGTGEITEALQQRVRDTYTVRFVNTTPLQRATTWILAINVVIFFVEKMPFKDGTIGDLLYAQHDLFAQLHLWQLVTPIFTHYAIWHLLFNCGFLWFYAPALEGVLGSRRFVTFYLYCGVVAELVSWFALCYVGKHYYAGTGASGALFGVAAAFIALHRRHGLFRGEEIRRWTFFVVGYIVVGFAADTIGWSFVDNWAHLGGFLAGFLWISFGPKQIDRA